MSYDRNSEVVLNMSVHEKCYERFHLFLEEPGLVSKVMP